VQLQATARRLLAAMLAFAFGLLGASPASAVTPPSTYDGATYTYDASSSLSMQDVAAPSPRGSPAGPLGASWEGSVSLARCGVAANTAGEARPFAMGISDNLDDFAATHGADTWTSLPDPVNWQPGVLGKLQDPGQRVLFNLDGVDVWPGVTRAAAGRGGATDWELLQIRNSSFPNLEFWQNGQRVGDPFE